MELCFNLHFIECFLFEKFDMYVCYIFACDYQLIKGYQVAMRRILCYFELNLLYLYACQLLKLTHSQMHN